ncbi:nickel-dependent hydrogenase large subunit [Shewanella sp. GXUN23E]|uniref:nickel-dependent hydrogenase large subunit n=1 Tax=Shewanella sp. GXUN23E TaxID=3422498 RepID=UPI003D7DF31A
MNKRILGPFSRVEGDLEIKIDSHQGKVTAAYVTSTLFRGFETILKGKDPRDALVYTPRICGICSVSQSVAAATALAGVMGLQPTANGRLATNLILACENAADHLTHFYLFFMPDFCRRPYQHQPWFDDIARQFTAQTGDVMGEVLTARSQWLHLTGILAGKWPHSLALQPGGSSRPVSTQEILKMQLLVAGFREFLETRLFGCKLERINALGTEAELKLWHQQHRASHFGQFLSLAASVGLDGLGQVNLPLLSFGGYPQSVMDFSFRRGLRLPDGALQAVHADLISEDTSHSLTNPAMSALHPFDGETLPSARCETDDRHYTWCKAPRLDGNVVEVGALARQAVNGHPLMLELIDGRGSCVRSRVIARMLELSLLVCLTEQWLGRLDPAMAFCSHGEIPQSGRGAGLIEAARGGLGHWLTVEDGRIANYQIIAPTTWNFSPRDQQHQPGALEQALVGVPVHEQDADNVEVAHVVRSFDPCMVCRVH